MSENEKPKKPLATEDDCGAAKTRFLQSRVRELDRRQPARATGAKAPFS